MGRHQKSSGQSSFRTYFVSVALSCNPLPVVPGCFMVPERRLATARRVWFVIAVSALIWLLCALSLPLVGSVPVDYSKALAGVEPDHQILLTLRVPRVLLSLLAGGALALSGVLFQALLRDALADPYTLGVSSGASLGAVAAIALGLQSLWPLSIAGASITLLTVLGLASKRRHLSHFTLLMAGVTVSTLCTAGILFLHSVASLAQSISIARWLMGGIESIDVTELLVLGVVVFAAACFSFAGARRWNVLAVGEEWAAARGVDARRLMLAGYLTGSLTTGAITSLTGPIGFVGLIVPHALRMWLGADHRLLIPGS